VAVTRANVTLRLVLQGDDKASASVKSAGASVEGLEKAVKDTERAIAKVGITAETGFGGFKTAIGGALGKLGLVGQGIRTITSAAKEMGESLIEGARAGDRMDILQRQVAGVEGLIERVKVATEGMLPEAEITKAIAQFQQFQIPIENIDNVLKEVAKTSIRTGEDLAFMTDSIIAGVARESALRIDNLGVILEADKTKKEFAKTLGKEADALTQAERKAALLNETMRQMQVANEGVNLEASRTASLERAGTAFEDLWAGIKTGLADAAIGVLEFFGVIPERVSPAEQALRDSNDALELSAAVMRRATAQTTGWSDEVLLASERLRELNRELGRTATKQEALRLEAETIRLRKLEADEVTRLALEVDRARTIWMAWKKQRELGLDVSQQEIWAQEELTRLIDEREEAQARLLGVGEQAVANVEEQVKQRQAAEEAQRGLVSSLTAQLRDEEEILATTRGVTFEDMRIAEIKRQISNLDRANADDLRTLIRLTRELTGIEEVRAAEKELTRKRGRGRRRRRPEAETLADIVSLEKARLKAAGQLTVEQQEQFVIADATVKLDEIATKQAKRKLTAQRAATLSATVEFDLVSKLASIRERAAAAREKEYERGLEAAKDELRIRQELRATLAGEDPGAARRRQIQEAVDVGAIAGEEADDLRRAQEFAEAMDIRAAALERMREALTSVGEAGMVAAESQDEVVSAFGRFASALAEQGDEITNMVQQIAAASKEGAKATVGAISSAISVSGQLATAFIKDEQAKAVISGLIETAAAAASFAAQDYVGGALHTVAAALYFAAAGTSGKKTSAQAGGDRGVRRAAVAQPPADQRPAVTWVTQINAPAAVVGGTPQEAAFELNGFLRRGDGTGFGAEAA
jgi:hypothetical protein